MFDWFISTFNCKEMFKEEKPIITYFDRQTLPEELAKSVQTGKRIIILVQREAGVELRSKEKGTGENCKRRSRAGCVDCLSLCHAETLQWEERRGICSDIDSPISKNGQRTWETVLLWKILELCKIEHDSCIVQKHVATYCELQFKELKTL